ncbi:MAG: hypothetical protein QOI57_2069 [Rubrobacteraceae bacterium]|jgi:hypothetical protein|nr:hypothetical protein [Rubrobacteraceae bacterium]
MSPEATAALYGVLAGGIIVVAGGVLATLGILTGAFIERRLKERNKVRCVVSGWDMTEAEPLGWAACSFEVELFNEEASPTGLRGIRVEFLRDGERPAVGRLRLPASTDVLWVLNLQPQRWERVSLHAFFEGEEAREVAGFRRADFVGYFPSGKEFRRKIIERKDFVAARKKKHFSRKTYAPWWRRSAVRNES